MEHKTHRDPVTLWSDISISGWVNLYLMTKRVERASKVLLYVAVINVLLFRAKSIPQYILCDNKLNFFKHLSFIEYAMLSFLSKRHWEYIEAVSGCCSLGQYCECENIQWSSPSATHPEHMVPCQPCILSLT